MNYRENLNENQYLAVTTPSQHVRVIAGAGSGKTRVLTYRISYLISEKDVLPWKILAFTFTNKAASEMKSRILNMIPEVANDLTIRTFHSFAANFLRREISILGFPSSFSILDEEDQIKLVKDIAATLGYKRSDKIVNVALAYIGRQKMLEKYPSDIKIIRPAFEDEKTCLEIYQIYEEEKYKNRSLDFDDLLLQTNLILENYPQIRSKWQDRIDHILIDEFQDTNNIEYKMINFLKKPSASLYVVGDPDQTIYTWRGANQNIILDLNKRFLDMETIVLERNYRSTQSILNSANKLIAHNKLRVPKNLYTEQESGEVINVHSSPSGRGEADYVAREIAKLKDREKCLLRDIVILYRSNYVTMDFEAALTIRQIPYKIYGGTKFYQRREIKDVLAYFRLIVNTKDDISFSRIINVPKRGIGEVTEALLKAEANEHQQSLYEYVRDVNPGDSKIASRLLNSLKTMVTCIEIAKKDIDKNEEVFSKILEDMIWSVGYQEYLQKEEDAEERVENVRALFEDIRHYLKSNPESTFDEYLQNIALLSSQDEIIDGDYVTLMTIHTAKGLEFPVVFLVRLNQGVLPNNRALIEGGYSALEEERRLAYVAMTRAKRKLYLTFTCDYSYVLQGELIPSQFLKESGNDILTTGESIFERTRKERKPKSYHFDDGDHLSFDEEAPKRTVFEERRNDVKEWRVGDIVKHKKLGRGVVIALEGDDIITVNFDEHGKKSMLGTHPSLSKGGH
ncbi:MAG TPA: UvrD-helicase domain-containing protein [Erysipelotrichaceae bacterium]|nr:UvrD-helicase domain-containing protein [Erysipelotrichaceae bacterium]